MSSTSRLGPANASCPLGGRTGVSGPVLGQCLSCCSEAALHRATLQSARDDSLQALPLGKGGEAGFPVIKVLHNLLFWLGSTSLELQDATQHD